MYWCTDVLSARLCLEADDGTPRPALGATGQQEAAGLMGRECSPLSQWQGERSGKCLVVCLSSHHENTDHLEYETRDTTDETVTDDTTGDMTPQTLWQDAGDTSVCLTLDILHTQASWAVFYDHK